ncbi:phage tail protein [Salibacterium halotolerans]|uniref:Chaperone of endosialidase n=1 Tax=Salibacterium halotolerans TaxID=1884432 RepID=A0A1I5MQ45_9BACI|nr:phage tail protein [Salibacterium halotolerans]SFP11633.1 Chaperone of endosialidase [Salibacterium halotolerans]
MAEFYTILTDVGQAKIANSQVTGEKVDLVELAAGDGNGNYYNPTSDQSELVNETWRGNISSIDIDEDNPNWITIETIVPSETDAFMLREVGIFDSNGDLIAIGKYPETYKPSLDNGSAKDLYVRMIIEVSNAEAVTLKIDPAVTIASRKYVNSITGDLNDLNTADNTSLVSSTNEVLQKSKDYAQNAKDYAQNRAALPRSEQIDPNTTETSLIVTDHANAPTDDLYYIQTYFDEGDQCSQIAIPYNFNGTGFWYRFKSIDTWSDWARVVPQSDLDNLINRIGQNTNLNTSDNSTIIAAINEVLQKFNTHNSDDARHVTSTDRGHWNGKMEKQGESNVSFNKNKLSEAPVDFLISNENVQSGQADLTALFGNDIQSASGRKVGIGFAVSTAINTQGNLGAKIVHEATGNRSQGDLAFYTKIDENEGDTTEEHLRIKDSGELRPGEDNAQTLGSSSYRWNEIYAGTGAINTSDKKEKKDIKESIGLSFIDKLTPIEYKLEDSGNRDENGNIIPGTRPHHGLISQDVESLLEQLGIDHAGFIKTPITELVPDENWEPSDDETEEDRPLIEKETGEYNYGLRYSEFIGNLIKAVQELKVEKDNLESKHSNLEKRVAELESS